MGTAANNRVPPALTESAIQWDVFAADDRYLGAVEVPEILKAIDLRDIAADHVWGIVRLDLDVQYVVRARIIKPDA